MNSKHTKRALLSSALALVLCFTMLIGTTFAWFTDTASTNVNTIQAGTLDVALEMYEDGQWVDAEGKTLNFMKKDPDAVTSANPDGLVQSADILWEPGCTYKLPTLRVRNDGNLALKYKIEITGINGDAKLNEAIEWTIKTGGDEDHTVSTNEWYLLPSATTGDSITIQGHMKESAGNEYQGLSIEGVAITVYATQYTYEYDMNGNQYDADAKYDEPWDGETETAPELVEGVYHITNAAELVYAMNHAQNNMDGYLQNPYVYGTYVLESNIDLGGATVKGFACTEDFFAGSFDGQGYTISNFTIDNAAKAYYGGLFGYVKGGTIKNLTVANAVVIGQKQIGVIAGCIDNSGENGSTVTNCKVYNSTVIATKKVGAVVGYALNSNVTDCYAENCTVYYSEEDAAEVLGFENTGCTASGNTFKNVTVKQANVTAVSNAAELKTALTPKGQNTNRGIIILTKDITVSDWTAVNVSYTSFVLDGNGHSISGLTDALVTSVGPDCTVEFKNLTLKNVNIYNNDETGTKATVGALVNCVTGEGGGVELTIDNCHIDGGSIYGWKYAGGFIGMIGGTTGDTVTIKNSTVKNVAISTTDSSVGGFVGHTHTDLNITNCSVLGNSSVGCDEDRDGGAAKAGWFVGTVNVGTTKITGCTNSSTGTLKNVNATPYNDYVGRNYATTTVG